MLLVRWRNKESSLLVMESTTSIIARGVVFHSSSVYGLGRNHRPLHLFRLKPHASCPIARRSTSSSTNNVAATLRRNGIRYFHKPPSFSFPLHRHGLLFRSTSSSAFNGGLFASEGKEGHMAWDRDDQKSVKEGGNFGLHGGKKTTFTAVLLGWLGAENKHLKRYSELYRSRGFEVVTFVVPPWQLFGLDLGRRVERRIKDFTRELVSLVSETEEENERESCLLFHTFSNTGWLTYGAILDNLESRADILEKIKGCVIDSGADSDISPQVWAAGFCAALLKKRSSTESSVYFAMEVKPSSDIKRQDSQDVDRSFFEVILFAILERFFSIILFLPDVNSRLAKLISVLSERQPLCPQLYLYSSADKVIPVESVERFIGLQKASGRIIHSYNFEFSPHVDHLRSFPLIYSDEISKFLQVCLSNLAKQL